jgi:hypothetical protein
MPAGLAVDLSFLTQAFDTMDATDEVDRQLQVSFYDVTNILVAFDAIRAGGTGNYSMPDHVELINRGAYETGIDNAYTAIQDLLAAFQYVVTLD